MRMQWCVHRVVFALCFVFAVGACQSTPSEKTDSGAVDGDYPTPSGFEYIPADTAYVMANFKSTPEKLIHSGWGADWTKFLKSNSLESDDFPEVLAMLADKIKKQGSISEVSKQIGFDPAPLYACYGLDLAPVCQIQLDDRDDLEAFLDELEDTGDLPVNTQKKSGREYKVYGTGKSAVVLRTTDKYVRFGLSWNSDSFQRIVSHIVDPQPVDRSLAQSNELHSMAYNNDFLPYDVGYFDIPDAIEKVLDKEDIGKTCRNEIMGTFSDLDRVVFGNTTLTEDKFVAETVLEIPSYGTARPDWIGTIPGYEPDLKPGRMAEFGLGIEVGKLLDQVKDWKTKWADKSYECEQLESARKKFVEGVREGLEEQMDTGSVSEDKIPSFVKDIKGFSIEVEHLSVENKELEAMALIDAKNPGVLLGQLQMMPVPALRQVSVEPNGKPVRIDGLGDQSPYLASPHIAMDEHTLGVLVGNPDPKALGENVTAKPHRGKRQFRPIMTTQLDLLEVKTLVMSILRKQDISADEYNEMLGSLEGTYRFDVGVDKRGLVMRTQYGASNISSKVVQYGVRKLLAAMSDTEGQDT